MGRIVRLAAIAAAVVLAGCVSSGPVFSPQQVAAVSNAKQINDELARQHKITWTEATRREIAEVERVSGIPETDADRLLFSYRLALAAEVDAGRMTPELADYRYGERIASNQVAAQQRQNEAVGGVLQAVGAGLQAGANSYAQSAQQNRTVNCTSTHIGMSTSTTCY